MRPCGNGAITDLLPRLLIVDWRGEQWWMNDARFESLSDEVLIHVFSYFDASDLFYAFHPLNARFTRVLQSLTDLHLTVTQSDPIVHLPCLEHLVFAGVLCSMPDVHAAIFSNHFPRLRSCHLSSFETIETIRPWTVTPSLRTLKIGLIDFHTYKAILRACPNLSDFTLSMFQSYLKLSHVQPHFHLKRLAIASDISDWRYNDHLLDMFLACVPNLEHLTIRRSVPISKAIELIPDYDWLASIIAVRLPTLTSLRFYLQLERHLEFLEFLSSDAREQLSSLFLRVHHSRYRARFRIQ